MNIRGFEFPDDLHYWIERDMWCEQIAPDRARVGITALGVHLSGNFFMCRPKAVGTALEQGQTLAIAELNKTVVTIKTPVSGTVALVNPLLADTPEIIEKEPYGAGWLVELQLSRWQDDLALLVSGSKLPAAMSARVALENLDQGDAS